LKSYNIKIAQFEGPFDLLLFFIQRDELDIDDIPISKITNDFLDHIRQLEVLNIDVASEFILVAATLMRIKTKMLIPRKELDEHGVEIDPRAELAQKLIEYKRYKEVIDDFKALEDERLKKFYRGNATTELKSLANKALVDIELETLSLYKLMLTFQKMMENYEYQKNRPVHKIIQYNYSIEEQRHYISSRLKKGARTPFKDLFLKLENRIHAIITFIALLELLNRQEAMITQGEGINNFWVEAGEVGF
jgi:segregation and condensation protein A